MLEIGVRVSELESDKPMKVIKIDAVDTESLKRFIALLLDVGGVSTGALR